MRPWPWLDAGRRDAIGLSSASCTLVPGANRLCTGLLQLLGYEQNTHGVIHTRTHLYTHDALGEVPIVYPPLTNLKWSAALCEARLPGRHRGLHLRQQARTRANRRQYLAMSLSTS
jgi:hypothetical protein